MTEMRSRIENHERHMFPCDCGDWHFVLVEWDEDPSWRMLELTDTYHPRSWRDRVKAAWKMLRGKPHYHGGVLLDEVNATDLHEVIGRGLPDRGSA